MRLQHHVLACFSLAYTWHNGCLFTIQSNQTMKLSLSKLVIIFILVIVAILALHPELTEESQMLQLGLSQLWVSLQEVGQVLWEMGESVAEIFKFLWNKYISN